MSPGTRRGRPRQDGHPQFANSTLLPVTDPLDDIAAHIDGAFVLVVKVNGGRYRRRCFLSVAAADKAARNAQAAGYTATVFLAELKPLWKLKTQAVAS